MAYTTVEEKQKKTTTEESVAAAPVAAAAPKSVSRGYDAAADTNYQTALKNLQNVQSAKPIYANSYESQLNDLYNNIVNREKFTYDINADALYQQYKDQYANMGKLAMRDTMGQAAALTGGYGSTYGQAVGQQQYNAYLQQLNDVVPELYGMAYGMYQDEGNALMNQYGMLGDMAADEYGKYQDSLSNYWQDVSYQQGLADDAYNRGYQQWSDQYALQQDAYSRLTDMMMTMGYVPTAEERAAAGMSDEQFNAWRNYYLSLNQPVATGGSGGGGGGGNKTLLDEAIEALDAGYDVDDVMSYVGSLSGSKEEYNYVGTAATKYAMDNGKMTNNSAKAADDERYEIQKLKNKK